jgi:hypothetical protein
MFTELPKLLDRNYMVGFLLPAAVLAGLCWWILALHGLVPKSPLDSDSQALIGGTAALLMVWLVSILLLALNRQVDRLIQGYGWTGLGLAATREREKFEAHAAPVLELQAAIDKARSEGREAAAPMGFGLRLARVAERYPDELRWLLPTRYGNRIRAAEVYSRAVYGLDAVTASYRISALLPPEFRELLNGARAQVDFCISLVAGGLIGGALFLGLGAYRSDLPSLWPAAAAGAMIAVGYALAVQLAMPYGAYLRSAFDLGREPLAASLGLAIPGDPAEERRMWKAVSQMLTFRSARHFGALAPFRKDWAEPEPPPPADGPEPPSRPDPIHLTVLRASGCKIR